MGVTSRTSVLAVACVLVACAEARAQRLELVLQGGVALPTYEQTIPLSSFRVDRIEGRPAGDLVVEGVRGPVFGAAFAVELAQVLAIEVRFDQARLDLETSGARFDLAATGPSGGPPITGTLTFGGGSLSLNPLSVWSVNLRLRTPGPVSFFASGGASLRPELNVDEPIPITLAAPGLLPEPLETRLRVRAEPEDAADRLGGNAGAGLRVAVGPRFAILAEARVFAFRTHQLRFDLRTPLVDVGDLTGALAPIRFEPVYVQVAGGLVVRF